MPHVSVLCCCLPVLENVRSYQTIANGFWLDVVGGYFVEPVKWRFEPTIVELSCPFPVQFGRLSSNIHETLFSLRMVIHRNPKERVSLRSMYSFYNCNGLQEDAPKSLDEDKHIIVTHPSRFACRQITERARDWRIIRAANVLICTVHINILAIQIYCTRYLELIRLFKIILVIKREFICTFQ